jgi:hypothetical protein
VAYERAELPLDESEKLEEHLFACAPCSERLDDLSRITAGVREVVRRGLVPLMLTRTLEERLVAEGVQMRVFHCEPELPTPCGAASSDEIVVAHLAADLTGVTAVELSIDDDAGLLSQQYEDVPVEALGGLLRVAFPGAFIRTLPDSVVQLRVSLRREGEPPRDAVYTLHHSHSGPPA